MMYYGYLKPKISTNDYAEIEAHYRQTGILSRVFYGGVLEEVIFRWSLLSLFVWIFQLVGLDNHFSLNTGVFVTSLLFAIAHIPSIKLVATKPKKEMYVYTIVGNIWVGLCASFAFIKSGLFAAIIVHMLFHLTWHPIQAFLYNRYKGRLENTKNGRPQGFENVSLGVSGFEWFPNGNEFIVSSQSSLLPTGWSPIRLYRIPVDANLAKEKIKPFYTIQTKEPDLFGIDADYFKWSSDGKCVSFLVVPTASWSMDSNTLCVLSSQGKHFQAVGKMLGFKDWFKWALQPINWLYIRRRKIFR